MVKHSIINVEQQSPVVGGWLCRHALSGPSELAYGDGQLVVFCSITPSRSPSALSVIKAVVVDEQRGVIVRTGYWPLSSVIGTGADDLDRRCWVVVAPVLASVFGF